MYFKLILIIISSIILVFDVLASDKFLPGFLCKDTPRICISRGSRTINGYNTSRDCWEYSYHKTCKIPSKNNCNKYAHCYFVNDINCLLRDRYGNCVNIFKEYSCKSWQTLTKEKKQAKLEYDNKHVKKIFTCNQIPCIDGNCFDKSFQTNGEMMDSISKLTAASKIRRDKNGNYNLFAGTHEYCAKKPMKYSNCCSKDLKGWAQNFGAKCRLRERYLATQRSRNLCVYVGKTGKGSSGLTKHHYCCFSNMLDKVIQVEGRRQLAMNFGTGQGPNCRGFTLEEINKMDFEKMNFGEFIEEFKLKFAKNYKEKNPKDLSNRVKQQFKQIDENNTISNDNSYNKEAGWNDQAKKL